MSDTGNNAVVWKTPQWQSLPALPGAQLRLALDVLDRPADLLAQLQREIPWEQHRLRLFGREIPAPRLSCWVGDAEAVYTYSRVRFEPRPWSPLLSALRCGIAEMAGADFNSVLCNLYRNGNDAMGWHSDDEAELGPRPVIASLSLGAPRRFRLRHKRDADARLEIELPSGSLLLMGGDTQRHYRHDLPRALRVQLPRLNLTFRQIHASA
ncbi:DNA-N1-methyladenine dioxygenase [Tahibacter aquaticus]|uniref:DNA-N1-methyladenine dioxygenase n=1 Tax=Tahibacter aquaticus TaxID=520092 RepID=A0A4R6Z4D1_9GAMM|nr:alpha-ketoglutarate-dependent dioxygenase AlkB [Tahibacter aquaticus]TDR46513.1 DNA-N1-methyladenine dioxygenase [Tahibacter aquaticus]